ncbi:hypothetical protein GobsT_48940 [Gemmata obscuriglobus]|uniref:Uncharacterized protein n=1 Tax=Gemmata obscuriglobus TaxID=114 RepID=A0A2Z3GYP3_9BACT|nr:hypothetical protein [Gemmata obscuriglobus]AWM37172.1 hypothetical protein C1280_09145 [Gemmata obscuriglobus]QEG30094.1 hypothetical protein GobsT_48940 [Gemmata obscuriglobus]VTS09415.1 unnamed protein product [Gemmata obscuriglobus UQM 2246]
MLDTLLADGIASAASNKLAEFVIKALAVGGGFLAGYVGGRLIAWALDRWVFAHKAPAQLKSLCGLLCGVLAAIVVALIVFGSGGSGLFGGGGGGELKSTGDDQNRQQQPTAPPKDDKKTEPPKIEPKVEPKPTPGDVRVSILSGADVSDAKFYVFDGDPTPRTLDELKKAVAERPKDKPAPVLVFRFAKDRLSTTHPEMKRLTAWVQEAGIQNRFE